MLQKCFKKSSSKTAEATGDLIGNKIADKITSIGKPKEKEKTKETKETRNLYPTRKKTWDYFEYNFIEHNCVTIA